jgi:hypothetical protein
MYKNRSHLAEFLFPIKFVGMKETTISVGLCDVVTAV